MAEQRLEEIREARLRKRELARATHEVLYPSETSRSHTLAEIKDSFTQLQADATPVTALGRVVSLRRHGGVVFLDVADATGQLQWQISRDQVAQDFFVRLDNLDTGDFVQGAGTLITTARGVATLQITEWHMLSKSIRPLPSTWYGLKDIETRYRQREVDLLLNQSVKETLFRRGHILAWLRQYFVDKGFLEVQTPVLQPIAGGAAATPFVTHHNALDTDLYLRIAPEIYLKRLIIGGLEKVFEMGQSFRNEGVDRQHNPEFTTLELYQAYADYEDLMDMTEEMCELLAQQIYGHTTVKWQGVDLSFARTLPRLRYVDIVSERLSVDILANKDPDTYKAIFKKENLQLPETLTYAKLIDELYKELVRPHIIQPTILYDYPVEIVPLAKQNLTDPRLIEMFQLVVHGTELIKAYTELNDPVEQRARFEEQQALYDAGDREAHQIDEEYLRAMEYGMPPTAGWGLGIDRLVMFLTDSASVRDVLAFPLLKPDTK